MEKKLKVSTSEEIATADAQASQARETLVPVWVEELHKKSEAKKRHPATKKGYTLGITQTPPMRK